MSPATAAFKPARKGELRGWHVLAMILAFFGIVIAVNTVFIVYAVGSFPGEDERRSYLQGLRYNETLAERRVQAALGWRASAGFSAGVQGPVLEVTIKARDGAPLDGLTLTGELERPTDSRLDIALAFEPVGSGRYVARCDKLARGVWGLRARAATEQGEALDFRSELQWRPSP